MKRRRKLIPLLMTFVMVIGVFAGGPMAALATEAPPAADAQTQTATPSPTGDGDAAPLENGDSLSSPPPDFDPELNTPAETPVDNDSTAADGADTSGLAPTAPANENGDSGDGDNAPTDDNAATDTDAQNTGGSDNALTALASSVAEELGIDALADENADTSLDALAVPDPPLPAGTYSVPIHSYSTTSTTTGRFVSETEFMDTVWDHMFLTERAKVVSDGEGGYTVTMLVQSYSKITGLNLYKPITSGNVMTARFFYSEPTYGTEALSEVLSVADAALDTGYLSFQLPEGCDAFGSELWASSLSVTGGTKMRTVFYFDQAVPLPEGGKYAEGPKEMGFTWSTYKGVQKSIARRSVPEYAGALEIMDSMFEDEVTVTVDSEGNMSATLTLTESADPNDVITEIAIPTARNYYAADAISASNQKALLMGEYGATYTQLEIIEDTTKTVTIPAVDLVYGAPLRITTVGKAALNANQSNLEYHQFYVGYLHLEPIVTSGPEEIDITKNGVRLITNTASIPAGSVFDVTSTQSAEDLTFMPDENLRSNAALTTPGRHIVYKTSLTNNGETFNPTYPVTLQFPIPESWDVDKVFVVRYRTGGFHETDVNMRNTSNGFTISDRTIEFRPLTAEYINAEYFIGELADPVADSAWAEDGLYHVDLALLHSLVARRASMANAAIENHDGYIEVQNGQARLYMSLTPIHIEEMLGYVNSLKYSVANASFSPDDLTYADILEYYTNGDSFYMDSNHLPYYKRVSFPLASPMDDNTYVLALMSPPMGNSEPVARLAVTGVTKLSGDAAINPYAGYERSALLAEITEAESLLSGFPSRIAATLQTDIDTAKQIYGSVAAGAHDAAASQTVKNALDALTAAIADAYNLLVIDRAPLGAKISEAKAITQGKKTSTAWNTLQAAIKTAQARYDEEQVFQSELNAALTTLTAAITAFKSSADQTGLDKDNLADGTYTLHADMIKTNRKDASMADGAINHDVTLTVDKGAYSVTVDFKGLYVAGFESIGNYGYLAQLKYYGTGFTYDQYGNPVANGANGLIPATVLSYQTDAKGNNIKDKFNDPTNTACVYPYPYPKALQFPLVNKASYEGDYVPLQVFVPIMEAIDQGNGTQDVLMHLDWSSLKVGGSTPTKPVTPITEQPANKTSLAAKLNEAKAILQGDYTDVSYATLQNAIQTAQAIYDSKYSTQYEVDAQLAILVASISGLTRRPANVVNQNTVSENGKYEVRVDLWHATQNKASMGNGSLNHTALIEVVNGTWYMSVSVHPMQVGTITASLASLQIKQSNGRYAAADIIARNIAGNKPSAFKFALPSRDTYIPVKVDPQVAVMGDEPVDARLRISWDTLTKVADNATVSGNTATSLGNADSVLSDAQTLVDETTGVTIEADKNVLPEGAKSIVTSITSGESYEMAKTALLSIGSKFVLFDISIENAAGVEIQPNGSVKVSLLIPSNLNNDLLDVYRINEDGTRTLMESTIEDGKIVFYTNHFSLYALVERAAESEVAAPVTDDSGIINAAETPLGASTGGGFNMLWLLIPIAALAIVAAVVIVRRKLRTT